MKDKLNARVSILLFFSPSLYLSPSFFVESTSKSENKSTSNWMNIKSKSLLANIPRLLPSEVDLFEHICVVLLSLILLFIFGFHHENVWCWALNKFKHIRYEFMTSSVRERGKSKRQPSKIGDKKSEKEWGEMKWVERMSWTKTDGSTWKRWHCCSFWWLGFCVAWKKLYTLMWTNAEICALSLINLCVILYFFISEFSFFIFLVHSLLVFIWNQNNFFLHVIFYLVSFHFLLF